MRTINVLRQSPKRRPTGQNLLLSLILFVLRYFWDVFGDVLSQVFIRFSFSTPTFTGYRYSTIMDNQEEIINSAEFLHVRKTRAVETMSETSEGTTTTTTSASGPHGFDSREELLEYAAILNAADPDNLYRDRFRVDRRKLEQMLLGSENGIPESADIFFHRIMTETNTFITWPSRLKIGAKSKKDPHLKVVGHVEDVEAAKEKILEILNRRESIRVTMKLDVSYTDHSHIIGKGGLTIKRVMEETKCHIHFPDSNRSNYQEKSNQVSIAGEIESAEAARARVRNLTPLIFSFELPIMGSWQSIPDSTTPEIVKIQEKYNIQVMFRTRPKLHSTLVLVKGCEWEVQRVKEATVELIKHICKHLANQIQIQMAMEISPQHHSTVLGRQNSNLKQIMRRTLTQIMFPDAGDPNIPNLKKSNVIIMGNIDNVYAAREQLIGSLPLILMFDLPETIASTLDTESITNLMQSLDVMISVRHRPKQTNPSVIIRGVERNASRIYEARRRLLQLDEPRVEAAIPISYFIPNDSHMFLGNNSSSSLTRDSPYGRSVLPSLHNLSPFGCSRSDISTFNPNYSSQYLPNHPNVQMLAATRQIMHSSMAHAYHPRCTSSQSLHADYLSLSSTSSSLSSPGDSWRTTSPRSSTDRTSKFDVSDPFVAGNNSIGHRQSSQSVKIEAIKAMQTKSKNAGCAGVRETMPASEPTEASCCKDILQPNDLWDEPTTPLAYIPADFTVEPTQDCDHAVGGMNSGFLDEISRAKANEIPALGPHDDLDVILTSIGLEKYIRLIKSHEVDLTMFRSLTDKDLFELGITAWGARRKMLLLIAELNKRTMVFSGSVAPGAERKFSLTKASSAGQAAALLQSNWSKTL